MSSLVCFCFAAWPGLQLPLEEGENGDGNGGILSSQILHVFSVLKVGAVVVDVATTTSVHPLVRVWFSKTELPLTAGQV